MLKIINNPLMVIHNEQKRNNEQKETYPCLICLEEEPFALFQTFSCKCKGSFHSDCLQKWFHQTTDSFQCPLCRVPIHYQIEGNPLSHVIVNIEMNRQVNREVNWFEAIICIIGVISMLVIILAFPVYLLVMLILPK